MLDKLPSELLQEIFSLVSESRLCDIYLLAENFADRSI